MFYACAMRVVHSFAIRSGKGCHFYEGYSRARHGSTVYYIYLTTSIYRTGLAAENCVGVYPERELNCTNTAQCVRARFI